MRLFLLPAFSPSATPSLGFNTRIFLGPSWSKMGLGTVFRETLNTTVWRPPLTPCPHSTHSAMGPEERHKGQAPSGFMLLLTGSHILGLPHWERAGTTQPFPLPPSAPLPLTSR